MDISDNGPGILESAWSTIFDMFYTFSHGDRYPSGTGVGLAISQGILSAHGGSARVLHSNPDTGTTIRITLPLIPGQSGRTGLEEGSP
jgi:two-component system sensor histidine kinase KdpD